MAGRLPRLQSPRWRPVFYVPSATVLSFLVIASLGLLGVLLAIFFVFAIPYLLGERRPLRLGVAALVVLFLTAVVLAGFVTWDAHRPEVPIHASLDGTLTQGTATPFRGDRDTPFRFRVVFTHDAPPRTLPRANVTSAYVGVTVVDSYALTREASAAPAWQDGEAYTATVTLRAAAHQFHFAAQLEDGRWVETTEVSGTTYLPRGPLNVAPGPFFALMALGFVFFVFFAVGVPTAIILLIYRWVRGRPGPESDV